MITVIVYASVCVCVDVHGVPMGAGYAWPAPLFPSGGHFRTLLVVSRDIVGSGPVVRARVEYRCRDSRKPRSRGAAASGRELDTLTGRGTTGYLLCAVAQQSAGFTPRGFVRNGQDPPSLLRGSACS